MAHPLWPLFDLRLRTARLELRLPTDDEIVRLAELARRGVHEPGVMPFTVPWTTLPSPQYERGFVQFYWGSRASWRPDAWRLVLMVTHEDEPIGSQGVFAEDFASRRLVNTGSWLGRAHQGRGFGREMRAAVLALAFDHLGAEVAESEAMLDNLASAGVSRSIGYEDNGIGRLVPEGEPRDTRRFRLTLEAWRSRPRDPVEVIGLEPCLDLFGVPGPTAEPPLDAANATPTDELLGRLDAAARAFDELEPAVVARAPWPLAERFGTEPEAAWGPLEVLAHVEEMLSFWLGEVERVLARSPDPVPFGRVPSDTVRLGIIERDRTLPIGELYARVAAGIDRYRRRLPTLTAADLARRGVHPRDGEQTVREMLDRYVIRHVADHVDQMRAILAASDRRAGSAGGPGPAGSSGSAGTPGAAGSTDAGA